VAAISTSHVDHAPTPWCQRPASQVPPTAHAPIASNAKHARLANAPPISTRSACASRAAT
jgi:hypothetical protein